VKRPAKPIACPNKCGLKITGSYDRVRDLEFEVSEHAKEACPMRVVSCDFNGCNETMFAKDRRDHRGRHLRGVSGFLVGAVSCRDKLLRCGAQIWELHCGPPPVNTCTPSPR
jgi:hypothetical protein